MITIEKTQDCIIVSIFDGSQWYREPFANNDEMAIWAHRNGICLADYDMMEKSHGDTPEYA
jgi:hypothetical protein